MVDQKSGREWAHKIEVLISAFGTSTTKTINCQLIKRIATYARAYARK